MTITHDQHIPQPAVAGDGPWPLDEWVGPHCRRARYFTLPPRLRPRSVLIGRRRLILEAPRDWLERVAAIQAAEAEREYARRVAAAERVSP